jgi:hypothetical protein
MTKGKPHKRRVASPRRSRPYWRLVAVVLVGVAGYLLVSWARAPELAPGIAPSLRTRRMTPPLFPPVTQRRAVGRDAVPPRLPTGPMTGGRSSPAFSGADSAPPAVPRVVRTFAVVDLNSASLADLQTLPGMKFDYAQKIIAGRPYRSFREVVERGIPPAIVDEITPPAVIRLIERAP